jgi:ribosomal protein S18 acetylase RimI-like enzyme
MRGIFDTHKITTLAQDGRMLRRFFDSESWLCAEKGSVLDFIGHKGNTVSWLFVHPDHTRRRIGRSLLNRIIDTWERSLRLTVTQTDLAEIDLFSRSGFEVCGAFEGRVYGRRIPVFRMGLQRESEASPPPAVHTGHAADARRPAGDGDCDR